MRDLKFRAWDKIENKMKQPRNWDFIWWHAPSNWKDCYEIMQFTWLLDKNWNEIYEGDIYHQGDSRILYIVEWLDTGLKGRQNWNKSTAWISHFQSDIEVIWNIYESPDLIK